MSKILKFIFIYLFCSFPAFASPVGTHGIDIGFLMHPRHYRQWVEMNWILESPDMEEIINVGSRMLDWVDVIQGDRTPEEREFQWNEAKRVLGEPTPDHPWVYNDKIIYDKFSETMRSLPESIRQVLQSNTPLPAHLPRGVKLDDFLVMASFIESDYSHASRWLALLPYREYMKKNESDFRPWLFLDRRKNIFRDLIRNWEWAATDEKVSFLQKLAEACPLTVYRSIESCGFIFKPWVTNPKAGSNVSTFFENVYKKGQKNYQDQFSVLKEHPGTHGVVRNGTRQLFLPTYNFEQEVEKWVQKMLDQAYFFPGELKIFTDPVTQLVEGAVQIVWEEGALPHVNGVGGDTITMDASIPRWLETTQVTMRHELGHVLGFPDCYVEFWDEDLQGFVYYSLDPVDRMCASSGITLRHHKEALLKAYF